MIDITGSYTDQYEMTMGQAYFLNGRRNQTAIFDYFFRKNPFGGGYTVFAGLADLLTALEGLRFDAQDLAFFKAQGFHADYLDYLAAFRFTGSIDAPPEGELVFPTRPVVRVEAPLIEAQIIETLLLNLLNFESLIATKASRMRLAAEKGRLVDFGLRRAHGLGGYHAARAAIIGGFDATSNARAARDYDLPASGTMAHAYIQCHDDELSAFRSFAAARPKDCVLLVDTYDTLHSGVPHAITVALEMAQKGERLKGIRLDSGDLAYLAKRSRAMLDQAGLGYVHIAASNQLDEYVIRSLKQQQAPIDIYGVGTSLVTGQPDAALDGVYKLVRLDGRPVIKLSENVAKITLPEAKQVWRAFDAQGHLAGADVVGLPDEAAIDRMHHPFNPLQSFSLDGFRLEPQLHRVMAHGRRTADPPPLSQSARHCRERLALLPMEYQRFEFPHIYKVGISTRLKTLRDELIAHYRS